MDLKTKADLLPSLLLLFVLALLSFSHSRLYGLSYRSRSSHGYRGIDARRNLWVLPSGELLYYVAAVAILLDRDEEAQRHYTGHTEDIMW